MLIPYFEAFYIALMEIDVRNTTNTTRLAFRKYCFRKSEIFDSAIETSASENIHSFVPVVTILFTHLFMNNIIDAF